ncbi:uncharacterized protein LOC110739471 [Chenopodium quinoa]|uniref:uncharacterized protein LOC110739471 n=1 Tax=Chenopodium quinoa TaxID=63459 RepID=UPI000B775037|nr:uncharacterized protein LOC110739471 [Chenopodium quinoa]
MSSYIPSNLNPYRGPVHSKSCPPLRKRKAMSGRHSTLEKVVASGVRVGGRKAGRGVWQSRRFVVLIIEDPVLDLTTQAGRAAKVPHIVSEDIHRTYTMNASRGVAPQQVINIPGDDPVQIEDDVVNAMVDMAPATSKPVPVQPAANRGAVAKQARVAPPNPGNFYPKISFRVRSLNDDDPGLEYELTINESFKIIYYDYARRVDSHPKDITIRNAHGEVPWHNNPMLARIVNGVVLWVWSQVPEANMDIRKKLVYLREPRTRSVKKKVLVMLDESLDGLFRAWSDVVRVSPSKIFMFHENKKVTPVMDVRGAAMRNGDEVFCFTNK